MQDCNEPVTAMIFFKILVGISDILYFRSARGRGRGEYGATGGDRRGGGLYTREMGTICPFGVFSLFYSICCFKIGHFPFKT